MKLTSIKTCLQCGKDFSGRGINYCGRRCGSVKGQFKKGVHASIKTEFKKDQIFSLEIRKKISEGIKRAYTEGRRISFSKGKFGNKHHKWIKDRTQLKRQTERDGVLYQEWRKQVWLRDNFKCKIVNPDCAGRIEAHHILGWQSHPELRYQINNGITLCHAHHPRKRAEEKRLSPYFQGLVSVSKD